MHTTINRNRLATFIGRTAAVTFLAAAGTLGLHAQQSAGTAPSLPPISLKASLAAPLDLSTPGRPQILQQHRQRRDGQRRELQPQQQRRPASAASQLQPSQLQRQPHQRRRLREVHLLRRWRLHPACRWLPQLPGHQLRFSGGAGRNFNKTFGVSRPVRLGQLRLPDRNPEQAARHLQRTCTHRRVRHLPQLGGTSHVWSFTLGPIANFYTSDTFGAYAIGGVGFYHKTANFTIPAIGVYCDPFFGCYQLPGQSDHRQIHQQRLRRECWPRPDL